MEKIHTKEEIKELLKLKLNAEIIFQEEKDYDNEYHILNKLPSDTCEHKHGEVVSMLSAIKNESDFGSNEDWKDLIIYIAERLANNEEITKIGAYTKLSPNDENYRTNLFWKEY